MRQADVAHPPSSSTDRPSYSALVANVDSETSLYVADCRVQKPRQEMIEDLEDMAKVNELSFTWSVMIITYSMSEHDQEI